MEKIQTTVSYRVINVMVQGSRAMDAVGIDGQPSPPCKRPLAATAQGKPQTALLLQNLEIVSKIWMCFRQYDFFIVVT